MILKFKTFSTISLLFVPIGNLLGSAVDTTIEGNLEEHFRYPSGCAEQTMIKLAPNSYILKYLMNTNQLTGAGEEMAYYYIQKGMLNVVSHRSLYSSDNWATSINFSYKGSRTPY